MRKSLLIGVLFTLGSLLSSRRRGHTCQISARTTKTATCRWTCTVTKTSTEICARPRTIFPRRTGGLNEAPYPRIVSLFDAADLEVVRQPCVDDGNSESVFMHRKNGPDLSMGDCVEYPEVDFTHEIKHGYGGQHIENCARL